MNLPANGATALSAKSFRLPADQIKPLAAGRGTCFATDCITVDGDKVGYMYRQAPDNGRDSGWRFFAGHESDDYVNDLDHIALYDVNTIANYDRDIIALLDAPAGSAFQRDASGAFHPVEFPVPDAE